MMEDPEIDIEGIERGKSNDRDLLIPPEILQKFRSIEKLFASAYAAIIALENALQK